MFDREIINRLPINDREEVIRALSTIHISDLIAMQRELNRTKLVSGSLTEEPEKLTGRILDYRKQDTMLAMLDEVAAWANREISK